MIKITLEQIAHACGGTYVGGEAKKNSLIQGVATDSRKVKEGFLFIPVKGERVDGHDFIPKAFAQGAIATLTEKPLPYVSLLNCPGPYIQVASSLIALKEIARYYRRQLPIPVVGITGSVGKTGTKEMIASVLSVKYNVLKTAGNFNNEIGLPLTLLQIQEEHEVAVVEMGISDFGEMHRLADMAEPDIGVITNIGTAHLENLKDRDGVFKAKTEMFDHLRKGATVILNGDDDKLIAVKKRPAWKTLSYYGMENREKEDIYGSDIENLGLKGSRAKLATPEGCITMEVRIPGIHNVSNALAAAGVGLALGLNLEELKEGIRQAKTIGGRSNLLEARGLIVIDDCYNANPTSMKASIDLLKQGLGRTVAVLGDMGELGPGGAQLHYEVGAYAAEKGIDVLFCTGQLAQEIAKGAKGAAQEGDSCAGNCEVHSFGTMEEMLPALLDCLREGDTVLVKASHFMDFAKVVERIVS